MLAAGLSRRMGTLKALLPWHGKPLIAYQIEQMQAAGVADIIVVLGYRADKLLEILKHYHVQTVYNVHYEQGKSTSIQKGVAHIQSDTKGIIISAVDQPVPSLTLKKLIKHFKATKATAVIPVYKGKRGHPIILNGNLQHELLAVNEETKGLRHLIKKYAHQIEFLQVDDPSILLNFNKPSDYKGGYNESFRN